MVLLGTMQAADYGTLPVQQGLMGMQYASSKSSIDYTLSPGGTQDVSNNYHLWNTSDPVITFTKWFLLWSDGRYPLVLSGIKRSSFLWCVWHKIVLTVSPILGFLFVFYFSKWAPDQTNQFRSKSRILCKLQIATPSKSHLTILVL